MTNMQSIALFSGGLDSILAAKLISNQGIKVIAVSFTCPFFGENDKEKIKKIAETNGFNIRFIPLGINYFNKVVKKPKYGYGKYLNSCVDCKIYLLKKAKKYADKIKAKIIITGEVLGQRPKSQQKKELKIIEEESGLKGSLLRPLSAKLLEPTEAEKKGWINRKKLLAIQGRQRKKQLMLAKKFGIKEFKTPAGGCLLTYEEYSKKLKELIDKEKNIDLNDLRLLKLGRHFRFNKAKIVVGRNESENKKLQKLKEKEDIELEVINDVGPITILRNSKDINSIKKAAELTAFYSDSKKQNVKVKYNNKKIVIKQISKSKLEELRI